MVPKAELHVHLEGTAPPRPRAPDRRAQRAARPRGRLRHPRPLRLARLPRLPADLRHGGERHPHAPRTTATSPSSTSPSCAADGAIYVELIASPDHAALVGLSDEEHLAGIAAGIDDARARPRHRGAHPADLHPQLRRRAGAADRPLRGRAPAPLRRRLPDGGRRGRLPAGALRRGLRDRGRRRPGLQRPRRRVGRGRERPRGDRPARDPHRPRRARDRGPRARRGDRRARARPRVLPDEQRRPRRLRQLRDPPPARPARGGRARHPRLGRSAVLRRVGRRRVRRRGRAVRPERPELVGLTRTAIEASFAEPPLRAALLDRLGDGDGRPT